MREQTLTHRSRYLLSGVRILTVALVFASAPSLAHHSFALFDQQKNLTLTGTVREFQWTNPHIWLQLNVANAGGGMDEWGIEGSTPSILGRRGWTRHSFQPGDQVTVTIHPMKDGQKGGSFVKAVLADGHT